MSGAERLEQVRKALTQAARYAPTSAAVIATALDGCVLLTREEADFLRKIVRSDLRPEWKAELDRILGGQP